MPESPQPPPLDRCHADDLGGAAILDSGTLSELVELGGSDGVDFLLELIDLFIEDGAQRVKTLRAGCDRGEADTAARAAHALKSASANVGALALSACCRELEAKAHATACISDTAKKVEEMYEQVRECLIDLRNSYRA